MDQQNLELIRHSAAHLLAAAVLQLYPKTKLTIGPAIESGFYYDFEFPSAEPRESGRETTQINESDFPKIENEMRIILKTWTDFAHREASEKDAKEFYKNNPYKLELIREIVKKGEKITFYKAGEFEDLCRGGHSENPSKDIGAFKLLSIAGAYWRGSEKNKMLTRIYGTAFPNKKELDDYLAMLEEAKKRDHKKLGPQMELFFFHETSPGMPYWLPKGTIIYNELLRFWREEHTKRGYQETVSPMLNKKELYQTSGHFDHYWKDMFVADMGENEVYGVKAMNCPNAMNIFDFKTRSYRDLPLRFSDTDPLHRFELSGTLNGLLRVRQFRQDDAHIFVQKSQIKSEFENLFKIVERFYSVFGLKYSYRMGLRPEKFMGDPKIWDFAEQILQEILKESGKDHVVAEKEGAFYGPKIDILMKDSLGREWQMGTLQLDFQQPERFKLKFVNSEGTEETPIAIHRVVYGSLERFIGILIEHTGGAFPTWLAPVQIVLLPIADRHIEFAEKARDELRESGIRAEVDTRSERLQAKIRDAALQKTPFMGIIGDKELEKSSVSVRGRGEEDLGSLSIESLIKNLKEKIDKKI